MTTQKRRVIYMTDQEWALLKAHAENSARSISEVIRDMWRLAARKSNTGDK